MARGAGTGNYPRWCGLTRNDEDLCAGWQPDLTEDLRTHEELVDDAKNILRSDHPPKSFRELVDRLAASNENGPGGTSSEANRSRNPQQGEERV